VAEQGALAGIRVIDAASARGELAGRVLADLGAEVLAVEPPGGARARGLPPFAHDRSDDPEASLYWAAVALGKRSVVLDALDPRDAERLRELAREADVFIEAFEPGALAPLGLDWPALRELNPALVYVSISPFGQDGPLARAPATDLTLEAAGGLLGLQGDPDRPPLPVGFPQAFLHAGVQAAADSILALCERQRSGLGQHLDVSAQAAVVWTLMNATGYPPATGGNPPNTSEHRTDPPAEFLPGVALRIQVPCADGWALLGLGLPGLGERSLHAVLRWAERAGQLPEALRGADWQDFIRDVVEGRLGTERLLAGIEAAWAFIATRGKRELQEFAARERILLGPVYDVRDLRADRQLAARDYWTAVGARVYPGPFARLSHTPIRYARAAPALGDSQRSAAEPDVWRQPAPARPAGARAAAAGRAGGAEGPSDALAGLKVADFSWVAVAPQITKALADHGATVVRVESETRLDITRQLPPFKDGKRGINNTQFAMAFNTSKLGLALDLTTEAGQRVARRLCDWADVVVESFTPGTMERLGLGWETLSAGRPDLVMLSSSLRGQSGPERTYTGFGTHGAALAGLISITGWPDRPPAGPWGAYTDFIAPRYGLAALCAALHHRARTGRGQHIDFSQIEAAIHFLEPLVLDYTTNGRVAAARGHASPYACPHGVYRAAGHERYLAITVETEPQWEALRALVPLDEFADPALRALEARCAKREAIEARMAAWCAGRDAFALAGQLRAAGVPAYAVLRPSDLYDDPQLAHRGFFVTLEHPTMGPMPYDGPVTRFSRTPARLRRPGPLLGEHTHAVLRELLGYSDDEIGELAIAGALS
jgi:crotonobetainyl-CoA:carnitine CoA-transferase CaiB-like acyl-CoA transferase